MRLSTVLCSIHSLEEGDDGTILTPGSCGSLEKLAARLVGHAAIAGAFSSIASPFRGLKPAGQRFSLVSAIVGVACAGVSEPTTVSPTQDADILTFHYF